MPPNATGRLLASVTALAAAIALAAASPGTGLAGGPTASPVAAEAALEAATESLAGGPAGPPDRGATVALAELAAALPALDGAERRRARALLARPTDGSADPYGDGYLVPAERECSEHFCIHYVSGTHDVATPEYVDEIAEIAETAYAKEVDDLGWPAPRPDGARGGDPRTDIYLKQLGQFGIFGYAASDPGQRGRRRHGYMVIDNDFRSREFRGFETPLDAARVTVAHELNHLLQDAISVRQDPWMFESTATWVEEKVFPEVDDYLRYVRSFARSPGIPITSDGGTGLEIYGAAVWSHWLENGDRRYGPDVVREAWEASDRTRPRDFAPRAYHRAIVSGGGRGFAAELVDFAAASAEWRSGAGGFPDGARHAEVRREGVLRRGRGLRFDLSHTSYRLLRVPRLRAPRIRITVRAPRGVVGGLALVTRRGGPVSGNAVRRVKLLPRGGRKAIALRRPRRFRRITAVAVNADSRIRGAGAFDWRYLNDDRRYRARVVIRR